MINAINLSILRNAEFIQFSKNFTSLVNANNPLKILVQSQYNEMVIHVTELENLFKTETSSPITAEIEALDLQRDQAINGIMGVINGYSYHFDAVVNSAATVLQNNLKLYDTGIARENYQSETAIINNLIADWENKPELKKALTTLHLDTWVSKLKTANINFDEKYLARTKEYAGASTDNQKSKRAEVMAAYYDLRKFIEAFTTIQRAAAYDKTVNELNALINQYNTLLNGRLQPKTAKGADTNQMNPED